MTRFSDAKGRKVVSTTTAETVGKVADFVVDPATRSVIALVLKKTAGGSVLRYTDLTAVGDDAVTVSEAARIVDPDDTVSALTGKDHKILGKRVLATSGDELGEVKDVDFDAATGGITRLLLDAGEVAGERLLGIGSYAVVVRAEA